MLLSVCILGMVAASVTSVPAETNQTAQSGHTDHSHAWLGKWESTKEGEENLAQLLDQIRDAIPHYTDKKVTHEYIEEGEQFLHKVKIVDGGQEYEVRFKLNEEATFHLGNEPDIKYVYKEEGPNKLTVHMKIPSKNKELKECYNVEGDKIVKNYESGNVKAKRIYKRVQN
ncbi:secretory-abundant heat soluble protein 1-like [Paramacrobiotus metropolitanus]|uniref:secretory-abundant heat soluble protein 1-like n=1 Tax=Paramacrobiotus metropolitanus TaxID=2943436 RepID=UPI002446401E|nr:secretory-abundant heat soluble protein 1-like [Paramacrobiotus metropolitanus]